nr:MAG TPA: hypothetical protein [Caudoviricetes sp.]
MRVHRASNGGLLTAKFSAPVGTFFKTVGNNPDRWEIG